jgi:hypothetical protein
MNHPHDDPLDDLLAAWQVETQAPADFQRHVWQRIAVDQEALPWTARLLSWWLQPRRLIASAAAALSLGALLGLIDATWHQHQARTAYFTAINPLDSHHQHHPLATR